MGGSDWVVNMKRMKVVLYINDEEANWTLCCLVSFLSMRRLLQETHELPHQSLLIC